ncbi:MAG: hypothetical protein AAGF12_15060 [Myxococcota bacterium]
METHPVLCLAVLALVELMLREIALQRTTVRLEAERPPGRSLAAKPRAA